jgi:hypothetical protein
VLLHELDDLPVAVGVPVVVEARAGAAALGHEQRVFLFVPGAAGVCSHGRSYKAGHDKP